ncbi:MAG: 50S ribosomal protein L18 [Erysipelotrichia bacterium]|jgi:large subunit ribosomal protein L18|nr:50S ribosomal protein L18 [Bacilli bacterium]NLB49630.1 50S ribosomal protein L18 [Erysipelotrichia bacterium]
MIKHEVKNVSRKRRHIRVRNKISGTADCPRLNVFRSNQHIEAQLIDDVKGVTLAHATSIELKLEKGNNIEAAAKVGQLIGEKAKVKKIKKCVFDRSGYIYHGRVKALAEAARKAGLEF